MQINLKVTMEAMPIVSPSILENYVTKEALTEANYVQDVVNPAEGAIYGRQEGEWVALKQEGASEEPIENTPPEEGSEGKVDEVNNV